MITHKSVEKIIYLHSISINHTKLLIISITANTIGQKNAFIHIPSHLQGGLA